jgi:hypothetical protein
VASEEPFKFMNDVLARTGAFSPRLVVDILRAEGDHKLADMIEGMADRIDELERNQALNTGRRRMKKR